MLKTFIEQINKATLGNPIFYISANIERALGIEDLLRHYKIITSEESYVSELLKDRGVSVEAFPRNGGNTLGLIKSKEVQEYIGKHTRQSAYIQVFKNSSAIKKAAEGYSLLNPDPTVAKKIENKVTQYDLLKSGGFVDNMPKGMILRLPLADFETISQELGSTFVAQFDLGHSGSSTFFINNDEQFDKFKKRYESTNMLVKFTSILPDRYVTINAVATRYGTYIGGLCDQITGLIEINAREGETCGNNWNQLGIDENIRSKTILLTEQLGDYLYKLGYGGMFGVDYSILDGKPFIIEINARQTQSIQHFSKLQIERDQVPLPILHILEHMRIPFDLDRDIYNTVNNEPQEASSLIIRNHSTDNLQIHKSYNGLYSIDTFEHKESGYSFSDIYSSSTCIVLESKVGSEIKPGDEYFKIIARGSVVKDKGSIDDNILKIIEKVNKDIK